MVSKRKDKAFLLACVALATSALTAGCSYSGDTSGFKAEQKPSKAEIQQQMAQLRANPRVPMGVKAMALKKLAEQQKDAQ